MKNDRYIFLVAHQRSGSHFLGYCIGQHPQITYVDEITTLKSVEELHKQLKTEKDVLDLLEDKYGDIKTPMVLIDVKYEHIMPALEKVMKKSKVIHMFRENKLDTYYSALHSHYRREHKLGEYIEGGEVTDVKEKPEDPPMFLYEDDVVFHLIRNELMFRRKYGYLVGLTFSYEELTKNALIKKLPDWAMKKICKFLKIEECPMVARTIKMSPANVKYYFEGIKK